MTKKREVDLRQLDLFEAVPVPSEDEQIAALYRKLRRLGIWFDYQRERRMITLHRYGAPVPAWAQAATAPLRARIERDLLRVLYSIEPPPEVLIGGASLHQLPRRSAKYMPPISDDLARTAAGKIR